jgi:hypothetical protein
MHHGAAHHGKDSQNDGRIEFHCDASFLSSFFKVNEYSVRFKQEFFYEKRESRRKIGENLFSLSNLHATSRD